jgi:hypothetical protein
MSKRSRKTRGNNARSRLFSSPAVAHDHVRTEVFHSYLFKKHPGTVWNFDESDLLMFPPSGSKGFVVYTDPEARPDDDDRKLEIKRYENIMEAISLWNFYAWKLAVHRDLDWPYEEEPDGLRLNTQLASTFSHHAVVLAAALGEFLNGGDLYIFISLSGAILGHLLGQPLEDHPEWVTLELLYWAVWGTLNRLSAEVLGRMRGIDPKQAEWREQKDRYLSGLKAKDRAMMIEAIDKLEQEGRPLKSPEIFGPRVSQQEKSVLSDAKRQNPPILQNQRNLGYYPTYWTPEKIVGPK